LLLAKSGELLKANGAHKLIINLKRIQLEHQSLCIVGLNLIACAAIYQLFQNERKQIMNLFGLIVVKITPQLQGYFMG